MGGKRTVWIPRMDSADWSFCVIITSKCRGSSQGPSAGMVNTKGYYLLSLKRTGMLVPAIMGEPGKPYLSKRVCPEGH